MPTEKSHQSYKDTWNDRSQSLAAAIAAVDASTDEALVRHTGSWAARQVRIALDVGPRDRLLELGCGVGRIGRDLAPHCAHWTGVDIAENMLRHAANRLKDRSNVSFHQLHRSSLEMLPDDGIDKAYSVAVFCHMDKEDLYLYLQDLHRVVRPGGMIFVETWNLAHPVGWRRWEYEPLVWSKSDQSRRKDVARNQFCMPQEFELYVNHAGFETLAVFAESQSVQILAGRAMTSAQAAAERKRIAAAAADIAYSSRYAEFFGLFVDMIFGRIPPAEMLAAVDAASPSAESALFRPYLLSVWKTKTHVWGEPPV